MEGERDIGLLVFTLKYQARKRGVEQGKNAREKEGGREFLAKNLPFLFGIIWEVGGGRGKGKNWKEGSKPNTLEWFKTLWLAPLRFVIPEITPSGCKGLEKRKGLKKSREKGGGSGRPLDSFNQIGRLWKTRIASPVTEEGLLPKLLGWREKETGSKKKP